ncbi:MAG: hypothetical protein JWM05_13 [Acidimicrobiales bacterium]|nr:hypothetical protein [Acidimicrobiales bacterium]
MHLRRSFSAGVIALALVLAGTVACSSKDSNAIEVVSTKTACTPKTTELTAGKVTFEAVNKGDQTTELYVLEQSGKVVTEVENIGPGTSRTLTATLNPGRYILMCKPGQTGRGIRTTVTVTGHAVKAEASNRYDREVELTAKDHVYVGAVPTIKAGERVEFKLANKGIEEHELEVFGPDGTKLGEIGPTKAGATGEVIVELAKPGSYELRCGISDHAKRGMTRTFKVT